LIWASQLSPADHAQAWRALARLERDVQQQLVDELQWQQRIGCGVRSPVSWLQGMARKAALGTFTPLGAHQVALHREQAAVAARAAQVRSERATAAAGSPKPADSATGSGTTHTTANAAGTRATTSTEPLPDRGGISTCSAENRARLAAAREAIVRHICTQPART